MWCRLQWGSKADMSRTQEFIVSSSFRCMQHPTWSWSPGPELTICLTRTRTRQKVWCLSARPAFLNLQVHLWTQPIQIWLAEEKKSSPSPELDENTLRLLANIPKRLPSGSVSFSGSGHKSNRISRLPSPDCQCQSGSTITHSSEASAFPLHNPHKHSANMHDGFSYWLLTDWLLTPSLVLLFIILLTLWKLLRIMGDTWCIGSLVVDRSPQHCCL